MLRESYLATADFITSLVEKTSGVDEADKRKAAFFIKQAVDAASPSNFLMTNPAALRALLDSHGESLKQGVENLAEDLKRGKGMLSISQTATPQPKPSARETLVAPILPLPTVKILMPLRWAIK